MSTDNHDLRPCREQSDNGSRTQTLEMKAPPATLIPLEHTSLISHFLRIGHSLFGFLHIDPWPVFLKFAVQSCAGGDVLCQSCL